MNGSDVTSVDLLNGDVKVTYIENKRSELYGLIGKPVRLDNSAIGVRFSDESSKRWRRHADGNNLVWAADWAWEIVDPAPIALPEEGIIARIDAEILKLKDRITELEDTKKVLASL